MNEVVESPLLTAAALTKSFRAGRNSRGTARRYVRAVDSVSLEVGKGETIGIVGESGSGKSTLGRLLTRLLPIDSGSLLFEGADVSDLKRAQLRSFRRSVQMIHQNPYGSLDPTKTAAHAMTEPLLVHNIAKKSGLVGRAEELAERVALDPRLVQRRPDQLSGGQRQRVAIARSLSLGPAVLLADEPTSALDLSTRSEILNLLLKLQLEEGLAIVLISHDFATVSHLSHYIAVMYLGRIVEQGPADRIASSCLHPYTEALLSAVPVADPAVQRTRQRIVLRGEIPSPDAIPEGCRFRLRCPKAMAECATVDPPLLQIGGGHQVACLLHTGVQTGGIP
ncbi:peptide/nickel transport system ATP-binding protein/oligopeptide transport system ATP-binding protein [Antricoccus suffuscus]|uniref:Peptide/nickel transport system ATP-binding protein/oligopeptide transport system ATP-binding protein n=1 Tax=Antricoccus suffuscus TaxID=1629062 RepID=A0A2T0ZTV2_9ACTN|nr:ABC transporter ATP-binding protein [Antricoccus suffuscus]PRZ39697.1 peptide/nickel transport system ATP-binding protein/oligopeptide transport system ATP-binding protein [Antricoccus suffuscus]